MCQHCATRMTECTPRVSAPERSQINTVPTPTVATTGTHGLVEERGIQCTNIPKIRAMRVQVVKHSQLDVTGKFVTKPMSYVAALHLVPN